MMKFFVSSIMIVAIFTLSLACNMSFCPMQAHAAAVSEPTKTDMPPCHETNKPSTECLFMTNMDCLGIDLAQTDISFDLAQDSSKIDFAWARQSVDHTDFLYRPNIIRGPPFDTIVYHLDHHDLYLTTQRLRI